MINGCHVRQHSSKGRNAGSMFRLGSAVSRGGNERGKADPLTSDLTLKAVGATE